MHWSLPVAIASIVALLTGRKLYRWTYILIKTLPRDIRALMMLLKVLMSLRKFQKENYTVPKIFSELVKKHPSKIAFYYEDEAWTFEKVEKFSNKIANYFKNEGFQRGDTIALILENCIEYSAIWLGLSKNGIVTALINTNLVKDPLIHCITVANSKAVIFGTAHVKAISDITEGLKGKKIYQFRSNLTEERETLLESVDLTQALSDASDKNVAQAVNVTDPCIYIYTSGTTGLPKAAVISHLRYLSAGTVFTLLSQATNDDIIYTPLPLYHSAGGIIGVGQTFVCGITDVIRKKFSASNYFKDCAKYNVTIGQYVGELCRYLLATPQDESQNYPLKAILGNGLKPQIWKQFIKRFSIERVVEVYGATEGIAFLANIDSKEGAVGFVPRYLEWAFPVTIIKCNETTGEPVRNQNGYCIKCDVGEPGLIVAKIMPNQKALSFDGYTDRQASDKKVLCDVFRKGDAYFNSGDILEYDELGYYYFKDRTGDTFRWKGENVSTSEVEAVISNVVNLSDVAVYGVLVPHSDGRAGMAAIVDPNKNLNIDLFVDTLRKHLPSYAIPIFLRVMDSLPLTATFKLKKVELREEAYNIDRIKDDLYVLHPKFRKYVPLTKDICEEIENGKLRI